MSFLQTLLAFLAALTVLIFIHELGHYLVARWCGVRVLRFSIGFGRPLLTWRLGADREEWVVSAIPLGGYVKMLDEREERAEPIPAEELPRAFTRQSLPRRAAIVVAGPLANFLLAIALYALLGWVGVEEPVPVVDAPPTQTAAAQAGLAPGDRILRIDGTDIRSWNDVRLRLLEPVIDRREATIQVRRDGGEATLMLDASTLAPGAAEKDFMSELGIRLAPGEVDIGAIMAGGAAEAAGLLAGDTLVAVDGHPIGRARDLIERVQASADRQMQFEILRNGQPLFLAVRPAAVVDDASGATVGRIGAQLRDRIAMEKVVHGPLESLGIGVRQTWDMSIFSLRMLGKMITGDLSVRNLSGPVTIADLAGQTARIGWFAYVNFLALISISLGVLNLLPIPVLDGGHLVYYALEGLRGRPLSERFIELTQKAGLGVIMMMMALALFNDITRLIGS
ncbi:MAG: RIP metalloprotease RseP [Burkholderiaceae bacterium]